MGKAYLALKEYNKVSVISRPHIYSHILPDKLLLRYFCYIYC